MQFATAQQRKEAKAIARRNRHDSIVARIEQLTQEGYSVYDAKQQAALDFGITVVTLYNELRRFKKEETNN